jgi:nicotinamidase-related amidase
MLKMFKSLKVLQWSLMTVLASLLVASVALTQEPEKKTALIIVDMQNDFAKEGGALYVPSTEQIKPKLKGLIAKAREKGVPIIYTQDWHRPDDVEFKIWPPHTIQGSSGADIISDIAPTDKDYTVKKRTYNAFFETDLDMLLRQLGVKRVVVTGTVSNICVLNTAGDAALRGYEVVMPHDAIAPLNDFDQQATLREVSFLYQGKITTAEHAFDPNPELVKVEPNTKPPELKIASSVELPKDKTAVIVVDMQNDFAREGGALYVPDTKQTVEPIKSLLKKARSTGTLIVFTQDWHRKDDPEFKIWPPHTIQMTEGASVIGDFEPTEKDYYIRKRTYDAFFGTDLDLLLRQNEIQNVVITGTVSNICVLHTAGKARLHGYNVFVAKDGISSLTPFDMDLSLRQMSFLYNGTVADSGNIQFK